jgi:hypothetical protein
MDNRLIGFQGERRSGVGRSRLAGVEQHADAVVGEAAEAETDTRLMRLRRLFIASSTWNFAASHNPPDYGPNPMRATSNSTFRRPTDSGGGFPAPTL